MAIIDILKIVDQQVVPVTIISTTTNYPLQGGNMFTMGIVLFLAVLVFSMFVAGAPLAYIDVPSLIVILGITLPVVFASGLWRDFIRLVNIASNRVNTYTAIELKRSAIALQLAMFTSVVSGLLGTIMGLIAICSALDDMQKLLPSIGVSLITTFYGVIIALCMLPIYAKVKAILYTLEQ